MSGQTQETMEIIRGMLTKGREIQGADAGTENALNPRELKPGIIDNEGHVWKNLLPILAGHLTYDKTMDGIFHAFAEMHKNADPATLHNIGRNAFATFSGNNSKTDQTWAYSIDEFYKRYCEPSYGSYYTANFETLLDRDIKVFTFESRKKPYIIIQINTGADLRAGFSTPRIFTCESFDDFENSYYDAVIGCNCDYATCETCDWEGSDGKTPKIGLDEGLYEHWNWKNDALHCEKCQSEIVVRSD